VAKGFFRRFATVGGFVAMASVGASLRIKGRALACHVHAEISQHVLEDVIRLEAYAVARDRQRNVSVTEVVAGARECEFAARSSDRNLFVGRVDRYTKSTIRGKLVAVTQHLAADHEDTDFAAIAETSAKPALLPKLVGQGEIGSLADRIVLDPPMR
jgi:hypothetical protein